MSDDARQFFEDWPQRVEAMKVAAPKVPRSFGGLFQALMAEGALTVREKELIALGIAVAETCPPCIKLHVEKCIKSGATQEAILEAAGVAVMMRGGPAYTHIPEVIEAITALENGT